MRLKTISAIAIGALSFLIIFGSISTPASAQSDITVASLAAGLAAATTEADVATMVAAARAAGLSDTQVADAFGRASVATSNGSVLSAGYATFAASSPLSVGTLNSSFSAGQNAARSSGGGGGGGGDGGSFNPPSGGSGGGGGSTNE